MEQYKVIHLFNRFGFGGTASELKELSELGFMGQLNREMPDKLKIDLSEFDGLDPKNLSESDKRALRKRSREKMTELNFLWLDRMIHSKNMINEKMTLFWHHHFACIIKNPLYGQQFTNIIRNNATGSFRGLVLEISRSAAMIDFLHTKQNRKQHPNEDFARELCELYTLGRDQEYTEQDVQEIARCFTGWKHRLDGDPFINYKQHDNGSKTIFGQTGDFSGEDVIDLIIEKKACARFVCENVYKYFINPVVQPDRLEELTEVFYAANCDIQTLIVHIAESDWFYAPENIQAKIKSPIELMVGLARQFKIENENPKKWMLLQRLFDQVLYQPPNVKGWKVDREWIDSNSLPLRLRLPSIILTNAELSLEMKPDYDANPDDGIKQNAFTKRLGFTYDWDYFFQQNEGMDLKTLFFNDKISPQVAQFLQDRRFASKKEEVIQLISLPEYQLI